MIRKRLRRLVAFAGYAWRLAWLRVAYGDLVEVKGSLRVERGLVLRELGLPSDRRLRLHFAGGNHVGVGVVIQGTGTLSLGLRSFIGDHCVIGCNESIRIGNDVMIAQAVSIRDTDHVYEEPGRPMNSQGIVTARVEIGDDVRLGHGVVVLRGVTIGRGAIVAAGAVVNSNVAAGAIVGGVPARVLRMRPGTQAYWP